MYIPKHDDRLRLERFLTRSQKEEEQNHQRENLLSIFRKEIEDKRHRKPKTDSTAEEESEEMRPRKHKNRRERLNWDGSTSEYKIDLERKWGQGR